MKKAAFPAIIIIFVFLALGLAVFTGERPSEKKPTANIAPPPKTGEKILESAQIKPAIKKRGTKVYFPNGAYLKAEFHEGKFEPKDALGLLVKGPTAKGNTTYMPPNTRLISFNVSKDKAIVNFSKDILEPQNVGAEAEELTIYSVTNTLTEFPEIKEVLFQVEGKSEGEIGGYLIEDFWGHVGLYDQPFERNASLIKD